MSDVLNGNAANVTAPLIVTVTALSNNGSGAIRVTCAFPHMFGPNDNVRLIVSGVVEANFLVTIIDTTHFDCQGSTYTSTGTGQAIDNSLTPQVLVPTDGDPQSLQQSGMLSCIQALLDRDQYLAGRGLSSSAVFTNSGSVVKWTVPTGVSVVYVLGWGGGGGGEMPFQVPQGTSGVQTLVPCGVGGAGARVCTKILFVSPGQVFDIICGAGGAGGTSGGEGGGDGGNTAMVVDIGGGTYFEAPGAAGGGGIGAADLEITNDFSTPAAILAPGGTGDGSSVSRAWPVIATLLNSAYGSNAVNAIPRAPGSGGCVGWCVNSGTGMINGGTPGQSGFYGPTVSPGGAAGTTGLSTQISAHVAAGGSGGGGGGGGPAGPGGAGGNGGNGNVNSTGGNGTAGANATTATGAGGGGGGQGGQGSSVGNSGVGGNGGSGALFLWWTTSAFVTT